MAYQGAAHANVMAPFCGAPALCLQGGVPMSALQYERCMPPGNWDQGPGFAQSRAASLWGAAPAEANRCPSTSGAPAAAASSILSTSPQKKTRAAAGAAPLAGAARGVAAAQEEPWLQQSSASA